MLHDSLEIGSSVVISDDVTILTASHLIDDPHLSQVSKPVKIDDYAWICTGASIMPGVHIGQAAVVAAFAVVPKDVPPFAVVAGNPAVCVKYRVNPGFSYRPNLLRACYEAWIGLPWA
jgi:maltose O-acetyltransferase